MLTEPKWKLKKERFEHPAGTICYPFLGCDYGCSNDDERYTGIEHISMTLDPTGRGVFFTVPREDIERYSESE